jgi:HSP20 family protein
MAIVRWDPWSELARARRELDNFFGERTGVWNPAADITREGEIITMKIDLPGMTVEDVTVELRDSQLIVTGERKQEKEEKLGDTVSRERMFGSFLRTLALPVGVERDDIEATFANGELTVVVTLPAQRAAEEIEIKTPEVAAV